MNPPQRIERAGREAAAVASAASVAPQSRAGAPSLDTLDTLDALPIGTQARVLAVGGTGSVARRLMEMGIVPGAPVRVVKHAPLGDPIQIRVRNYHLALRRTEAQTIRVAAIDE